MFAVTARASALRNCAVGEERGQYAVPARGAQRRAAWRKREGAERTLMCVRLNRCSRSLPEAHFAPPTHRLGIAATERTHE